VKLVMYPLHITVMCSNHMNKLVETVLEDELYYALAVLFVCICSFGVGMLVALIL